jgi:hypothetical protein
VSLQGVNKPAASGATPPEQPDIDKIFHDSIQKIVDTLSLKSKLLPLQVADEGKTLMVSFYPPLDDADKQRFIAAANKPEILQKVKEATPQGVSAPNKIDVDTKKKLAVETLQATVAGVLASLELKNNNFTLTQRGGVLTVTFEKPLDEPTGKTVTEKLNSNVVLPKLKAAAKRDGKAALARVVVNTR